MRRPRLAVWQLQQSKSLMTGEPDKEFPGTLQCAHLSAAWQLSRRRCVLLDLVTHLHLPVSGHRLLVFNRAGMAGWPVIIRPPLPPPLPQQPCDSGAEATAASAALPRAPGVTGLRLSLQCQAEELCFGLYVS